MPPLTTAVFYFAAICRKILRKIIKINEIVLALMIVSCYHIIRGAPQKGAKRRSQDESAIFLDEVLGYASRKMIKHLVTLIEEEE